MRSFLFAVALIVPSWAQTQNCSRLTLSCGMQNAMCDQVPNLTAHTYAGCAAPFVCSYGNWTCRTKPMVGTPCMSSNDCQYANNQANNLWCNTSMMCDMPPVAMAPSAGCYGIGDPCMADTDCAWGSCRGGWCVGLDIGADCSNGNYWGCKPGAFCWSSDGSMTNGTCAMKKADGAAASWTSSGYGWSCASGFARNVTAGMPTCVSYSAWWGKVQPGGQCYYNDLGYQAHELCTLGYMCDMTTSTCMADTPFPATCNMFSSDCSNVTRDSNAGSCHCEASNTAPVCVRNTGCQPIGSVWDNYMKMWSMKCGVANPQPTQGRCPAGGVYDDNWAKSCLMMSDACFPPASWQACQNNFDVMHWTKVLLPSGKICGMTPGPMAWVPSFCSSASVAQPLIFVVVALMAFLRLA